MARLTLEALLAHTIDYAGIFPPASLPLEEAVANYREYKAGRFAWMLGRFVVDKARLDAIPTDLDGNLAVLAENDDPRAAAIETRHVLTATKPVYCEVPLEQLDAVAQCGSFAKIRTGGVTAEAIPSSETLAAFIHACAHRRLAFKATAGLHHPIRSMQPLTCASSGPHALMHGFINVLFGAAAAWHGAPVATLREILDETDASAFRFEGEARWRDTRLRFEDVLSARRHFVHSFGSCSFADPIHDLEQLGWL
jgi:hypothetical protein